MKNKNKDIFLIVPPTRSSTQRLPLSLMTISSYLTENKEENKILDFKGVSNSKAYESIKKELIKIKPKFVGLTCLISEVGVIKNLCEFIRKNLKDTKIIIGGPHPTICPHHFLDRKVKFDFLVIGEGEHTFYELIKTLRNNKPINKVKGLAYIKSKKLIFTKRRELIENLDSLPFPDYSKVDMDYYCRPNVWAIRPIYISSFNIFTSRGCPYSCNFCVAHTIFGRKVRFRSPEKIAEHIEYVLKKFKVDALYFGDDSFTVSKSRIYELFKILKKKKIKFLWGCETRVNLLDEKLLKFMKKNGCIQIDFGIESGSDRMLKIMNKGTNLQQITKIGNICKKIKLRHLANMLVNLPGETLKDIHQSVDLVKKMKYNVVLWNTYTPFPGGSFGKELDLVDLDILLKYPSKSTFELLENKYKFGDYSIPLTVMLNYLYKQTFHPKHLKLTLSLDYWISFIKLISFIFDYRYVFQMIKSKRKLQYITNIFKQKTTI